jgi:hypothetical protein
MDLLIRQARHRRDRQFFFLSPQDISGIRVDEHLTLHKLKDSERDQQAIDFAPQEEAPEDENMLLDEE